MRPSRPPSLLPGCRALELEREGLLDDAVVDLEQDHVGAGEGLSGRRGRREPIPLRAPGTRPSLRRRFRYRARASRPAAAGPAGGGAGAPALPRDVTGCSARPLSQPGLRDGERGTTSDAPRCGGAREEGCPGGWRCFGGGGVLSCGSRSMGCAWGMGCPQKCGGTPRDVGCTWGKGFPKVWGSPRDMRYS